MIPEWITKYWLEWIFGVGIAVLTMAVRSVSARLKKEQLENRALRDGMRSLLKSQIVESCERALRDGWCGARLRDSINDMYGSYTALGGNGTVTSIRDKVMQLPAVQPIQNPGK